MHGITHDPDSAVSQVRIVLAGHLVSPPKAWIRACSSSIEVWIRIAGQVDHFTTDQGQYLSVAVIMVISYYSEDQLEKCLRTNSHFSSFGRCAKSAGQLDDGRCMLNIENELASSIDFSTMSCDGRYAADFELRYPKMRDYEAYRNGTALCLLQRLERA